MAVVIEWFEADGLTPAARIDWGFVAPGQSGAAKTYVFKNTGDEPATNAELAIAQVGPLDMEGWITGTYLGSPFTSAAPLSIGSIAPAATGTITLNLAVPADAPLSSRPLMAQPAILFDRLI